MFHPVSQQLTRNFRYLQALKILEELERNYLPNIHKYRFTQALAKNVQPIRKQIREDSYSELTDFLEKLQKVSGQVGEDASKHVSPNVPINKIITNNLKTLAQHRVLDPEGRKSKDSDISNKQKDGYEIQFDKQGAILHSSPQKSTPTNSSLTEHDDINDHAQDKIDYAPIHRCCQVFNVLGEKDSFESYYREQRKEQCLVVSQTPSRVAESIHVYVRYLNEIIGFFVVEDRIMQIQPTLVTALHKDNLWGIALDAVSRLR